ncbi:MAG: CRISPR-associated protein [Deltaproteobacteria bacterium]|nr:CRISPR-associated protein [Deltaproteobacteria bacterium]
MPEAKSFDLERLIADDGPLRMVLKARLQPVAELDRFQPAGFPEIGHVIYDAPRVDGTLEKVCIVDSAASMANHLEAVCRAAPHDPDVTAELQGMPYLRCVTDAGWPEHEKDENKQKRKQVVVTSLTEGHRIASTYFLGGKRLSNGNPEAEIFEKQLARECGVLAGLGRKAHPPAEAWWTVFTTIFRYDPNALVHGVLFPQWQIKIPRMLTAHLEAFGAGRVDRSGVKFDRLGKTTSGQPIFAVDDATAGEIRATFVLDLALLRSFGRKESGNDSKTYLGLNDNQKKFLLALALWKIGRLLRGPFRYRSGCDLECAEVCWDQGDVRAALGAINIGAYITGDAFAPNAATTDIYWPAGELYRAGDDDKKNGDDQGQPDEGTGENEDENEEANEED